MKLRFPHQVQYHHCALGICLYLCASPHAPAQVQDKRILILDGIGELVAARALTRCTGNSLVFQHCCHHLVFHGTLSGHLLFLSAFQFRDRLPVFLPERNAIPDGNVFPEECEEFRDAFRADFELFRLAVGGGVKHDGSECGTQSHIPATVAHVDLCHRINSPFP